MVRSCRVQPQPLRSTPYLKTKAYSTSKFQFHCAFTLKLVQHIWTCFLPTDFPFLMQCTRSVTRVGLLLSSSSACRTIQNISERRTELQYWVCVCVWALLLCLNTLTSKTSSTSSNRSSMQIRGYSRACECVLQRDEQGRMRTLSECTIRFCHF